MSSNAHARFAPSGAKKWAYCMGALDLEDVAMAQLIEAGVYPPGTTEWPSTEEADEGTYAHGVFEKCMAFGIDPVAAGATDYEMEDAVQVALDYVYSRAKELGASVKVESKVHIAKDCWGTKDVSLHWEGGVEVIDFKYGEGVFVKIIGCDQLELYMIGELIESGSRAITDAAYECHDELITTIIQPRIPLGHHYYHQETLEREGPIRSTTLTMDYLRGRYEYFMGAIEQQGPSYAPSRETCRWCNAKGICAELAKKCLTDGQLIIQGEVLTRDSIKECTVSTPAELPMDARTAILHNVELIRAWLKAVEGHAFEIALAGTKIPGFKVVASSGGRRIWDDEDDVILKMLANKKIRKADVTKSTLLGPAPIEKLLKKLVREGTLSERQQGSALAHIKQPKGKRTLVPDADPRDSVVLTADEMFG